MKISHNIKNISVKAATRIVANQDDKTVTDKYLKFLISETDTQLKNNDYIKDWNWDTSDAANGTILLIVVDRNSNVNQYNIPTADLTLSTSDTDIIDDANYIVDEVEKHMQEERRLNQRYFGENEAELYGDIICDRLQGQTISKRKQDVMKPGGLLYTAHELDIPSRDLLRALEGLCYEGKCKEIDDSTYEILGDTDIVESSDSFESETKYVDVDGVMGNEGEIWTKSQLLDYFEDNKNSDPCLEQYDGSAYAWLKDTLNWLEPLDDIDNDVPIMSSKDACPVLTDEQEAELFDIAEQYNTSDPVSGDWNTETRHEQQAIADHFNISMEQAKQIMIDKLGFADDEVEESITSADSTDSEQYTLLRTKEIPDSDGFSTDYTLYEDNLNNRYVCVFGDRDVYTPEDGDFDFETESEDEANEWFDSYAGLDDDIDN